MEGGDYTKNLKTTEKSRVILYNPKRLAEMIVA
jgi:hypothetical protein